VSESELFELELIGVATERRYRQARDDVLTLPWGTLRLADHPPEIVRAARKQWTASAFQEHRTGAQCAATLRALFECRAPVDLLAVFSRFPLDELAHVEMAARLAMELGGAGSLHYDRSVIVPDPEPGLSPLAHAAHLVVRVFCVGETLSIPLLHATWQGTSEPLVRAVLGRIVRDEAAHGIVGWTFLDWVMPLLSKAEAPGLAAVADEGIRHVQGLWGVIRERKKTPATGHHALGWLGDEAYLDLAERALAQKVIAPLGERGIDVNRAVLTPGVRNGLSTTA
jgi:hypothetical protein